MEPTSYISTPIFIKSLPIIRLLNFTLILWWFPVNPSKILTLTLSPVAFFIFILFLVSSTTFANKTVDAAQVDPQNSLIQGNSTNATKNEISQFEITFYDSFGNNISSSLNFLVNITFLNHPNITVEPILSNLRNGTYSVAWIPNNSGNYMINATVNQQIIKGFPYTVNVPGFKFTLPYVIITIAGCVGLISLIVFIVIVVKRKRSLYSTL